MCSLLHFLIRYADKIRNLFEECLFRPHKVDVIVLILVPHLINCKYRINSWYIFFWHVALPLLHHCREKLDGRAVLYLICQTFSFSTGWFIKSVAVSESPNCFLEYAVSFSIQLIDQFLISLIFRNFIITRDYDNPFINPTAEVSTKFRKIIHAEPEKTLVLECERVFPFEFNSNMISAGDFLECLHFRNWHEP